MALPRDLAPRCTDPIPIQLLTDTCEFPTEIAVLSSYDLTLSCHHVFDRCLVLGSFPLTHPQRAHRRFLVWVHHQVLKSSRPPHVRTRALVF